MKYDYETGESRIEAILSNSAKIQEKEIPRDDSDFTYDNGIKSWVGSVFVDIVGSKKLIEGEDDLVVAKILRCFTSEIISIMNSTNNARQIGVRGDCVYGIFSVPNKADVYELFEITSCINTLLKMLNKLFTKYDYPTIRVGIGMGIGKDLIVKAGQKGTGINDRIWIGRAVIDACVLANIASRDGRPNIGYSSLAYSNFIDQLLKSSPFASGWFSLKHVDSINQDVYFADVVRTSFNKWISENL